MADRVLGVKKDKNTGSAVGRNADDMEQIMSLLIR